MRGSVADELVARCVVEALASTFYRVLRDACADALGRRLLATLSQDEARHYGMFAAMLQRGDVKGLFVGHDHINTYMGNYFGVELGYGPGTGFGTYGLNDGTRVCEDPLTFTGV